MNSLIDSASDRALVVTPTMNPALDITTRAPRVRPTDKIRCHAARYDAIGGGINVAVRPRASYFDLKNPRLY